MVARTSWILCLLMLLAGCGQTIDPCPDGYRASHPQSRCVPLVSSDAAPITPEEAPDAEGLPFGSEDTDSGDERDAHDSNVNEDSLHTLDAASIAETGLVADADADFDATWDAEITLDAALDGGSEGGAALEPDGGTGADATIPSDADMDAGPEAGFEAGPDASVPACSSSDVDAWRAASLADGMRSMISNCRASCDAGLDCVDQCLRQAAGLQGCADCTRAETECASQWCGYACLPSRTDRICRACLCQADCVNVFSQCAGRDPALCDVSLFGPDPVVDRPALDTAAMLLGKTSTGALLTARFDETTGLVGADTNLPHFPSGASRFVSLSIGQRQIVFQYGASCALPPCTVRGYPVLDDGTFGLPVFEERWDADFTDMETFSLGNFSYLARVRPDSVDASADNVLIDRLEWNADQARLERSAVLHTALRSQTQRSFSGVEVLAVGDATFLLLFLPETGEAR